MTVYEVFQKQIKNIEEEKVKLEQNIENSKNIIRNLDKIVENLNSVTLDILLMPNEIVKTNRNYARVERGDDGKNRLVVHYKGQEEKSIMKSGVTLFLETLKNIGFEKIYKMKIKKGQFYLIDREMRKSINTTPPPKKVGEYYIATNGDIPRLAKILDNIFKRLDHS